MEHLLVEWKDTTATIGFEKAITRMRSFDVELYMEVLLPGLSSIFITTSIIATANNWVIRSRIIIDHIIIKAFFQNLLIFFFFNYWCILQCCISSLGKSDKKKKKRHQSFYTLHTLSLKWKKQINKTAK